MNKENKKLTIVSGDGKDLEISPVYEHLKNERPKCNKKPTHIVVPKSEEDNKSEEDSDKPEQNRTLIALIFIRLYKVQRTLYNLIFSLPSGQFYKNNLTLTILWAYTNFIK